MMFEQGDEPVVRWKEVPRGRPSILMSPSTTPSSLRRARTSSRVWGEKQFRLVSSSGGRESDPQFFRLPRHP